MDADRKVPSGGTREKAAASRRKMASEPPDDRGDTTADTSTAIRRIIRRYQEAFERLGR